MGLVEREPGVFGITAECPGADINPPQPHELAKLFGLATETEVDLADFILLAATTGDRRSELVALRWSDLDLDRATVWIKRGIVTGFTGLVEKDT
jgi:integrase